MKRRAVIASIIAGLARTGTAKGQARRLRVGRLGLNDSPALIRAQDEGRRELGFVEGRNIEFVSRVAGGFVDKLPLLAAELAALQVDVIVVGNNASIVAAQRATSIIPIVMVLGVDPVGNGFIDSLPGARRPDCLCESATGRRARVAPTVARYLLFRRLRPLGRADQLRH